MSRPEGKVRKKWKQKEGEEQIPSSDSVVKITYNYIKKRNNVTKVTYIENHPCYTAKRGCEYSQIQISCL